MGTNGVKTSKGVASLAGKNLPESKNKSLQTMAGSALSNAKKKTSPKK